MSTIFHNRRSENFQDGVIIAVLTLLFFLLFWRDLPALFPTQLRQDAPVGHIKVTGHASRRPPGETDWHMVQTEGKVYLKDFIYTTDEGGAEIFLDQDNTSVKLAPNTVVQIYDVGKSSPEILLLQGTMDSAAGNVRLLGSSGPVAPAVPNPGKTGIGIKRVRPTVAAPNLAWLADPPEEAQNVLDETWRHLKFHNVNLDPLRNIASAQFKEDLRDYELRLITPPMNATLSNEWILLSWTPIPLSGTIFEVEVSRTDDFKRVMNYSTDRNKASLRFVGQGLFYWRVKASWQDDTITSKVWTLKLATP